jgi:hypothetical protein
MHSPLISWSRMVFLAGIVLALVLIIPTAWFPFQLGKLALFAIILTITSVLFVLGRGGPDLLRAHGLRLALMVGVLPLAYLLSTLVAGTGSLSVSGFGVETDTVLFTVVAFLAFIFSFDLFKTLRTVRMLATTLTWALIGIVAFQWVVVLFGTSLVPFSAFSDRSLNLVGKLNDLRFVSRALNSDTASSARPAQVFIAAKNCHICWPCCDSSASWYRQFFSRVVVHSCLCSRHRSYRLHDPAW